MHKNFVARNKVSDKMSDKENVFCEMVMGFLRKNQYITNEDAVLNNKNVSPRSEKIFEKTM